MFQLDDESDPRIREIRHQLLLYHMADVLTDRERARLLGLPEGCRIRERAKILAPEKLTLGKNVWIGEGAVLDAQGGLSIGDFTQIGLNVMVWSHSSHKNAQLSKTGIDKEGIDYKPTSIGSNCFIAGPSVIAPGVTIGNRVIVSPLTFVERDVPDDAVVSSRREVRELEKRIRSLEKSLEEALSRLPR
jgi:acetyltransferase-like isoleucine patch superfamily enzyme